jgi:hypothetical protein
MSEDETIEELDHIEEEENEKVAGNVRSYAPMSLLSFAMHLILLFIISLIPTEHRVDDQSVTVITTIEDPEVVEEIEIIKEITLDPVEVEVEPVETEEPVDEEVVEVVEDPVESLEDNMEEIMDLIPDEVSTVQDVSNLATLGTSGGASGASGLPSGMKNRSGKNKNRAVRTGGGSRATEGSVDAALKWLAEHQENDGSWMASKYEGSSQADLATTGLALLPFLGAGHTEMAGKYKDTVRQGIKYLNKEMDLLEGNYKGKGFYNNYGVSIALMAMSETTIFGSSDRTKRHAEGMAKYLLDQWSGQGWHYHKGGQDFSVSGWVALGLKSAKSAGLYVMESPEAKKMFKGYKEWTANVMTDPKTGKAYYSPNSARLSMSWVGGFQKQFLGFPRSDEFLGKVGEKLIEEIKKGTLVGGEVPGDVYQVYYSSLYAFQQQGEVWYAYNPAMKKTLIGSQHRGDPKQLGGSWDATKGHTGHKVGRVGTTAMFALCLEIYYRYDMMN